jgi:hypothetical protein
MLIFKQVKVGLPIIEQLRAIIQTFITDKHFRLTGVSFFERFRGEYYRTDGDSSIWTVWKRGHGEGK